jgi:hypothetical protein
MFQMLVAPLSELDLTDEERVLMEVLCIFAVGTTNLNILMIRKFRANTQ